MLKGFMFMIKRKNLKDDIEYVTKCCRKPVIIENKIFKYNGGLLLFVIMIKKTTSTMK